MKTVVVLAVLGLALVGCQAKSTSTQTASAPHVIEELTNQTLVYSCPKCGMDYDAPGKCSMCDVDLEPTQVAYVCPADDQPVERAGKCPRCNMNAKVVKTAMAASPTGTSSGS
jgi:hypothetical protein